MVWSGIGKESTLEGLRDGDQISTALWLEDRHCHGHSDKHDVKVEEQSWIKDNRQTTDRHRQPKDSFF